jgi:hypothetical protein
MNGTYGKVVKHLLNNTKAGTSDYLFISLIHEYHKYLRGENTLKPIAGPLDKAGLHPILLGRWVGYQLISKAWSVDEEKSIFSLAKKQKTKNHFFYEAISSVYVNQKNKPIRQR